MRCVRRALVGGLVLLLSGALSFLTSPASADLYPPGNVDIVSGTATVSTTSQGSEATFAGSGFARRSAVRVAIDGKPRITVTSTSKGTFSVRIKVSGDHAFTASGVGAAGRPRVVSATVTSSELAEITTALPGNAFTGPGGVYLALLGGLASIVAFVVAGVGIRVLRRMPLTR
ncbi:MAG: hypothetical protein JWM40_1693 [Frankiales bacterium]|nr:hypothetical protein [Frankiales bacterium]